MTPAPALVARFRQDCARLLGDVAGLRIALAVSGGPDSMAMLALAAAAFPGAVAAATVDHRLRADSAGEAAMVAGCCSDLGVPHATLPIVASRPPSGNLHAWARAQRYALLLDWAAEAGCAALLTAHHADDQAETVLMRLARGSGVAGLAGIRAWQESDGIAIVRPLLAWRSVELRAIAVATGVPFVDDPSNRNPVFERARVRATLAALEWLDPVRVMASARHAAEADDALAALARLFWRDRAIERAGEIAIDMTELPRELRRRLARQAIRALHPSAATDRIEPLLDALETGGSAMQGDVLASAKGEIWRFRPAPPRRSH